MSKVNSMEAICPDCMYMMMVHGCVFELNIMKQSDKQDASSHLCRLIPSLSFFHLSNLYPSSLSFFLPSIVATAYVFVHQETKGTGKQKHLLEKL